MASPLDAIDAAVDGAAPASKNADYKTKQEIGDLDSAGKVENLKDQRTDRKQRIKYAQRVFNLIRWWLGGVGALLLLTGFGRAFGFFVISDSVLIALVAGTSVNVIGTFAVVVNYLFRKVGPTTSQAGLAPVPKKVVTRKAPSKEPA